MPQSLEWRMDNQFIKSGVIGHPINHSKSPIIHGHWIEKYQLNGSYQGIDIAPENLERNVMNLISQGYRGFNVTIPHKQSIFSLCDSVDDMAVSIGAVNTVQIINGKLHGTNTDAFGFIENLKCHEDKFLKTKPVFILGAGGAAQAVVYALIKEGFENIIITNRTIEKSQEIAKMNPSMVSVTSWDNRSNILKDARLIVNTTSLGMVGKDALKIDLSLISNETIVCDIVYAPLMTQLLLDAQKKGCPIITGIGMLLHQARPAFEKWFGVMPDIDNDLMKKILS